MNSRRPCSASGVSMSSWRLSTHWLPEVLVDQLLEVAQRSDRAVVVERQHLHHHDAADVLHRINPELGVVNAGPTHASWAAKHCVLRVAGPDLKAETEFIVTGSKRKRFR